MSIGEYAVAVELDEFREAEVSLHTADPGRTGANEFTGNRYHRQPPPPYESIPNDGIRNTARVLFEGLPRSDINYVGFWCSGRFLLGKRVVERKAALGDGYSIGAGQITVYQMEIEE